MTSKACDERETLLREEGAPEKTIKETNPKTETDRGYAVIAELQKAGELGLNVQTPPPRGWGNSEGKPFHNAHFIYDEKTDLVRCPRGKELHPQKATRQREGRHVRTYRNKPACDACEMRKQCLGKAAYRKIEVCGYRKELEELSRRWREDATVRQAHRERSKIIEPRFAQIKQQMGFRRWSCFGREKALGQLGMLCATLNLNEIMRRLRERAMELGQSVQEQLKARMGNRAFAAAA
jgi:hypothetical protein